ncbi:MAG: hypothetical protein GY719_39240 [bacterium]|nr:hypothetical protein [bacterium]
MNVTPFAAALLLTAAPVQDPAPSPLDEAFHLYWGAEDAEQAAAAARAVVDSGASFDEVLERLRAGQPYSAEVKTGRVDLVNRVDRVRHHYRVLVPESYDPARRYPVRFYLHGGVSQPAWRKGGGWWSNYGRFEDPERISVFPSSWDTSRWWQRRQAENLPAILDHLKSTYNLDENAVHMIGISDGATGAYFFAFREPTPWASYLPFIGHPGVLANKRMGADGEMYARNLRGQAFFVVNSGKDRLYPAARVLPYLDLMVRAGAEVVFRPQPEAGHDTSWWPGEVENIDAFIAAHRRDPLPDSVTWETESTDRYHRNRWLLIAELGPARGESTLDELNTLRPPPSSGAESDGRPAFTHEAPSGRIEAIRRGNVIQVRTQGVRRYKLLLSPDEVDFEQPITVMTNGKESWTGRLEPDVATLLAWAARDNDRTMLFGAELDLDVQAVK